MEFDVVLADVPTRTGYPSNSTEAKDLIEVWAYCHSKGPEDCVDELASILLLSRC